MGQRTTDDFGVIDDTFAGLARPDLVVDMGRPDLEDERPGATLVEAVRAFERDGGFKARQDKRNTERSIANAPDAPNAGGPADFSLPTTASSSRGHDFSED